MEADGNIPGRFISIEVTEDNSEIESFRMSSPVHDSLFVNTMTVKRELPWKMAAWYFNDLIHYNLKMRFYYYPIKKGENDTITYPKFVMKSRVPSSFGIPAPLASLICASAI